MFCGNRSAHEGGLPIYAASVDTIRACYAGEVTPCGDLIEIVLHTDGGPDTRIVPCGAHARVTDRGWSCEAGHSYVSMEARHREGWDYYDEDEIAAYLTGDFRPAVEPRDMQGRAVA